MNEIVNYTGESIPKALRMELERKRQDPPKVTAPDRISNRVLKLVGHNGSRLRGTTHPA